MLSVTRTVADRDPAFDDNFGAPDAEEEINPSSCFEFDSAYPPSCWEQSTGRPLLAPAWIFVGMVNHMQLWAVGMQVFGCGWNVSSKDSFIC